MRQMPNLRYTARGRPQSWHRRRSRVENFGGRFALAIFDLLATTNTLSEGTQIPRPRRPSRRNRYFLRVGGGCSLWNGIPSWVSSSRDSSSVALRTTKVMFIPCTRVNLSGFSSGNTSCSDRPRL